MNVDVATEPWQKSFDRRRCLFSHIVGSRPAWVSSAPVEALQIARVPFM